jgi:hypothetical protein
VGEDIDVKTAEKQFKSHFADRIASAEAGLSEWICDAKIEELLEFVQELKTEYFIKLHDVPGEFQPLTMPMVEALQHWHSELLNNQQLTASKFWLT